MLQSLYDLDQQRQILSWSSISDNLAFFLLEESCAMEQLLKQAKPFLDYDEQVDQLRARGMVIEDRQRAIRKVTQVGYYRLSGYWHGARYFTQDGRTRVYRDEFRPGTSFDAVYDFYLFDKKLRLELLDALERIEVYFRTVTAHELGRSNSLCHLDKKNFSRDAFSSAGQTGKVPSYDAWLVNHEKRIKESHEDSIVSHRNAGKPIPIWVAAEVWDFGSLSKFYSMLNGKNQDLICNRIGITERNVLEIWLINLYVLRNRCAHHSRVCNRTNPRTLKLPKKGYFNLIGLNNTGLDRIYGLITVIWFLLKQIAPSSDWILRIANLFDQKPDVPGFGFLAMGIAGNAFPRDRFVETQTPVTPPKDFRTLAAEARTSSIRCVDYLRSHVTEPDFAEEAGRLTDFWLQAAEDIETLVSNTDR